MQFGCRWTQISIPNQLLEWQTLAADLVPCHVNRYSKQLAHQLIACHKIVELLVHKQLEWHHALINSCCQEPPIYSPGDIVFVCQAAWLDASCKQIRKLEYKFTGPWWVHESLNSSLYSIEYCLQPKRIKKKHAADLTPYPSELISFAPVDGANTQYGQLYWPISVNLFKEAGLNGFTPPAPFQVSQLFLDIGDFKEFCWPIFLELNDNINPYPWQKEENPISSCLTILHSCLP